MYFGGRICTPNLKSWELMLRNRTWDVRRATVGPHLAAISGQRRSLRVSPTGVCSTVHAARGILPSWPCEFDSRHPLHTIAPSQLTFSVPKLFEHRDDKNDRAGHACFLIIGAPSTGVPCQTGLPGRESGSAEVDHVRCRAQFVPNILTSFGWESRIAAGVWSADRRASRPAPGMGRSGRHVTHHGLMPARATRSNT
jgi:hypothetical protein